MNVKFEFDSFLYGMDTLIPPEILCEIISYLDVISLVYFTSASKTLARYKYKDISQYKFPCGYIGWRHQTCNKDTNHCYWCLRTQCKSLFIYINAKLNCRFGCL